MPEELLAEVWALEAPVVLLRLDLPKQTEVPVGGLGGFLRLVLRSVATPVRRAALRVVLDLRGRLGLGPLGFALSSFSDLIHAHLRPEKAVA